MTSIWLCAGHQCWRPQARARVGINCCNLVFWRGLPHSTTSLSKLQPGCPKYMALESLDLRKCAQTRLLMISPALQSQRREYKYQGYFCSYSIKVTICVTGVCASYLP